MTSLNNLYTMLFLTMVISSGALIYGLRDEMEGGDAMKWEWEWGVLSRTNYSAQITDHTNVILMVTLPWLGESRSLMKDIAERVAYEKQGEYGNPKLMLLYKNRERMLADAIGATNGVTIIFYHHSLSYKYQGRLRSQNILSSLQYLISYPSEHLPIQPLNTQEDLKTFLRSTEKALLLLEFCGWAQQLLAIGRKNGTKNDFDGQSATGFSGDSNGPHVAQWKKYQASESEKMTCDAQTGLSGIPWFLDLSSISESDPSKSFIDGGPCSSEKFQLFDTFFTKFMAVAREFFLPPERLRFGLIGDKSLLSNLEYDGASSWLSSLNVVDSDSWLMALHFSGCPTCSVILKEGDDLKNALQIQNPVVTELGGGSHDPAPTLPADKPSIILFIDRSSDSLCARSKSKETLDAFRSFAFQHHKYGNVGSKFSMKTESLLETHLQSKSFAGHRIKKLSSASQKVALKDKVSITVINEGKQVTLDKMASGLQGNSLHEILAYVLQGGNGVKLSSLAKEAGFQLLSEDFDVKVQGALPTKTEVLESNQPEKVLPETDINLQKIEIPNVGGSYLLQSDDQQTTSYPDQSSQHTTSDSGMQPSAEPVDIHSSRATGSTKEEVHVDEKLKLEGSTECFFFSDGGYQLLRSLTGDLEIPSVVIVDPKQQKHYVLKKETDLSFSSFADFLNGFSNGSLVPFQKSESGVKTPKQASSPPFVNLDFQAVDSIPRLTSETFTELVIGFNQTDNLAWKKDVMVLFSNSWCGFCQRMELVVREVYRVFKHYATMQNDDTFGDIKSRFPQFYFMDCTLNECSLILRSVAKREIYPFLLMFPAESKIGVSYSGDITVSDIIKFVLDYGSKAHDLIKEKGSLWAGVQRKNKKVGLYEDASEMSELEETPFRTDDKHQEVLFKYRIPEKVIRYNQIQTHNPIVGVTSQVVVGSLLIATEKLVNVHPFDSSVILIVKADEDTGFQGLIINKHISWDSLEELEEGLELLKEARLSLGGPLMQQEMPLLALTRKLTSYHSPQILPNVHFLEPQATIQEFERIKLRNCSISDYWFFLGYSHWGWGQLFNEISQGDWNITDADYKHIDWPWR